MITCPIITGVMTTFMDARRAGRPGGGPPRPRRRPESERPPSYAGRGTRLHGEWPFEAVSPVPLPASDDRSALVPGRHREARLGFRQGVRPHDDLLPPPPLGHRPLLGGPDPAPVN